MPSFKQQKATNLWTEWNNPNDCSSSPTWSQLSNKVT